MERIATDPDPVEQYLISQAIRVGDLLFLSGQAGLDERGVLREGFDAQAEQVFTNIAAVLEAGGSDLAHVVKVTIFVRDMAAHFEKVVALRRQWFTAPYPADSLVEVVSLYSPDALIEIECVAVVA